MTEAEALRETLLRHKADLLHWHRHHPGHDEGPFDTCGNHACHAYRWWVTELRRKGIAV